MEMKIMMQFERGFKLVFVVDDNTYWSLSSPLSGEVEYKIGKWLRPLIGLPSGTVLANSVKLTRKVARG